jgi:hypothetical protein
MTTNRIDEIERKIDQDIPLEKQELYWICSENRRMTRDIKDLLAAAQVALEGLRRFATNFTGTIVLQNAVAKHRLTGKSITNGKTTKSATAKRVEPL